MKPRRGPDSGASLPPFQEAIAAARQGNPKPLEQQCSRYTSKFGGGRFLDDIVSAARIEAWAVIQNNDVPVAAAATELARALDRFRHQHRRDRRRFEQPPETAEGGERKPWTWSETSAETPYQILEQREHEAHVRELLSQAAEIFAEVFSQRPEESRGVLTERDRYAIDQYAGLGLGFPKPENWPSNPATRRKATARAMEHLRDLVLKETMRRYEQALDREARSISCELLRLLVHGRLFARSKA